MRQLTTADVAVRPAPGTTSPTSIQFSPDGSTLTYLVAASGSLRQQLVAVDVATGTAREIPAPGTEVDESTLSIEERLRRERGRELAVGVTRYRWATRAERLLVPMGDGLWVLDGVDAEPRLVVAAADQPGPVLDAQLSADGRRIGWVSDAEVYVLDLDAAGSPAPGPLQVTSGARGTGTTNGLAEYIAQEEMGRPLGFWFSPNGGRLTFCHVDERHIPVYRIVHQGSDAVGPGAEEDHRYPFAGAENAHVRVGVVPTDRSGADPVWLDLGCTGIGADRYVARVDWAGDDAVIVQVQDRSQSRLDLIRFDVATGAATLLLTETSDVWLNLHDLLRVRADGSFLWASERSGFRHLELRGPDGTLRRQITSGPWLVTDVVAVGDDHVWFTSTADSPLERQLFRTAVDADGEPVRITHGVGVHQAVVHAASGAWVDVSSRLEAPPVVTLRDLRRPGDVIVLHDSADDPRVGELGLRSPMLRIVEAADGTELHAAVFAPEGAGPFPTVIWVYGGPHAQLVTSSWALTAQLRAQYLRQEGFCVAVVDGRGSANRGLAFEAHLLHRMGTVEVDDQVRLVEALVADGTTDPARVGVYGWSYGGYMSAMCLARRPDVFRAACAGAPVTNWDGYDTHYTERYMGTPDSNPGGYHDGAVTTHVEGLRDRHLLLIHGLIDENVHFRHTARLLNALVRADLDHQLLLYPDERHTPRGEADRASMEHRISEFFRESLR